jgi:hypothetical protein
VAQAGLRRAAAGGLVFTIVGAVLVGCAANSIDGALGPPSAKPALPIGPVARAAVEVQTGQVPTPQPYPQMSNDTCGANALAYLIGRPKTEIPIPADLSHRRVACAACPVAPDVRMDRLNIIYDAETGKVMRLTCG